MKIFLARIQNLARIFQESRKILYSGKFIRVFLEVTTNQIFSRTIQILSL